MSEDTYQKAVEAKDMVRKKTGIVYDRKMEKPRFLWDTDYPECPERLSRVLERCQELGLLDVCEILEPQVANKKQIMLKHTLSQLEILKSIQDCTDEEQLENYHHNLMQFISIQ